MTEEKKNLAKENLVQVLWEEPYLEYADGVFVHEFFAEAMDRLSESEVKTILRSEEPWMAFEAAVESGWEQFISQYEGEFIDKAIRRSYPADAVEEEEMSVCLWDYIHEVLMYEYPYEHYKEGAYEVDILIDNGDANYAYALNSNIYPHYRDMKGEEIESKASLVWLARTQGYTKRSLQQALNKGDVEVKDVKDFLTSVRQEVANETSGVNCLTFLCRISLKDLIRLNQLIRLQEPDGEHIYDADRRPDCGTVRLSRKATAGFFDSWNGAGSCFEIMLEKDIEVPVKYIRGCLPDSNLSYSVSSVYGMMGSAWKEDVVTDIREPETAPA